MEKIVLLDFDEKDQQRLLAGKFDVGLRFTGSTTEDSESSRLPAECEVLFYQMGFNDQVDQVQAEISAEIDSLVGRGGKVVCFIGKGDIIQLTGVIGAFPELSFQDSNPGESLIFKSQPPFSHIFDNYRPFIDHATRLIQNSVPGPAWDMKSTVNGRYEFLAKSPDGFPVSLLIHKGKGFYLLLPWFGSRNIEVADFILKEVFPHLNQGSEDGDSDAWLDGEEYTFPALKDLFARKEEEKRKYEQVLLEIEDRIRETRATEQEVFNQLLRSEGMELKKAVFQAFANLGWGRVVDVDTYWKKVIRNKEEDIWLIDTADKPVEACLQQEPLILIMIRGNKNWATDDDCAMLQKYKGRRMQEFGNTKMKAVLVGNYFAAQEARLRDNPFAPVQVEEAQKDGNGLLTTYELFKAIKAEKEGRAQKEGLRRQLIDKTGLIKFEY